MRTHPTKTLRHTSTQENVTKAHTGTYIAHMCTRTFTHLGLEITVILGESWHWRERVRRSPCFGAYCVPTANSGPRLAHSTGRQGRDTEPLQWDKDRLLSPQAQVNPAWACALQLQMGWGNVLSPRPPGHHREEVQRPRRSVPPFHSIVGHGHHCVSTSERETEAERK